MDEFKKRLKGAFKNGKAAWEAIAGKGATHMTPEQFKKFAADLGVSPEQAEKLFKEMDKDGDGLVSEAEFQNVVGVDEEEFKERVLEKFGNADEALKAADKDGDGMVSKEELKKLMEELGITPENAEKLAEELMKKYDTDGDGKLTGQQFKDIVKAKAEDLAARIQDKLGSAPDAFKKWDTDGDGVLSEEEFVKGAKELGISEEAAREIFRKKAGPDGVMDLDEFTKAFGVGPDDVMERCFAKLGNP